MKYRYITYLTYITILLSALFVMTRQLGLVDELDFGAGAYYYADDPAIQDMAEKASYPSSTPKWVYYLLFFAWGALMWFLWKWIDRRK